MTLASNKLTLAVIGSKSMVGSRFCELAKNSFNLIKADLNGPIKIDITDPKSISDFFKNHKFDYLILFSAFTDVDGAEKQRNDKSAICWKINVDGVKNIAEHCKNTGRGIIFISTDFVFDGKNGPYNENDQVGNNPNAVSWYGITKIEGEKIISKLNKYIILRISYPYRGRFKEKDDHLKRIIRQYQQKNLYPMFADQQITPTFIDDLAPGINLLLENKQNGIFHIASNTPTTPFKTAQKLLEKFFGQKDKIEKGSLKEFMSSKNKTPRPVVGGLKTNKIRSLGFNPTDWDKGIDKVYDQTGGKLI